MSEFRWMSAVEQFQLIQRGEVAADELRDAVVETCGHLDAELHFMPSPLFDEAPPGVPMLLKDAGQELEGTPHFVGLSVLRDVGHRSAHTTELATRFQAAGFSIIGKAACPALAAAITTEPPGFEPTRNPWHPSRSAGGSSGGSAAAVASGAVTVAHGSDATGSLRCPAALCGLVTLNPTAGLLPSVAPAGQPPDGVWRDFVLARHAEDLLLVYQTLTGTTIERVERALRVGLLDHDPELGMAVHPDCGAAVHRVGEVLVELGHVVDRAWPAPLDHLWASTFPAFVVLREAAHSAMVDWVGTRLGRPVATGELDDAVLDDAARAARRSAEDLLGAQRIVESAVAPIRDWWRHHDLLLTPATFQPAWPLGTDAGPAEIGTLAAPFSLSGQPALAVPAGLTADGLPVGVQIVGRAGDDGLLLHLAATLQDAMGWTTRHPGR